MLSISLLRRKGAEISEHHATYIPALKYRDHHDVVYQGKIIVTNSSMLFSDAARALQALSRVLKDSQRIGKMIHSRSLIRELDHVWKISIASDCGAAGSP
ncbi:MAG: hypothetical protein JW395_0297 [Nitrospira sp.]|nr:hypothetical protein [Nitrospira sp.]